MAQDSGTPNRLDEETPLLGEQLVDEQHPDPLKQPDQKKGRRYFWTVFWILAAALVLAVFVKGWIDAGGDVDVSNGFSMP